MIVIGLQEIVKLVAKNIIAGKSKSRNELWQNLITKCLESRGPYICLKGHSMVGCYILMYVKAEL